VGEGFDSVFRGFAGGAAMAVDGGFHCGW
jgi:hypothetical protein